ncbi:hypothetical protein [Maribacter sp.]|nr:hypothetical protein [Maribacter sp.]
MKKLELKNLNVNVLTKKEQSTVKGGFTTIGRRCKARKAYRKISLRGQM